MHRISLWVRFLSAAAVVCTALAISGTATAQLRVVTANPPEAGVHELAELFERDTGQAVVVETMGGGALNRLLASDEAADVVVGTIASLDQAGSDGQLTGARTEVGQVGIVAVVRGGAPAPDVSSVDALRLAALEADRVIYNTAGSGQYVDGMFGELGIGEEVRAKNARPGNGAETVERVFRGSGSEIGFGLFSEMVPHNGGEIEIVGKIPEAVQRYAVFEAAVLERSASPELAAEFIAYMTTPAARELFLRHGVD